MYSLQEYGNMIADKVRMDPYAYALKAAIKPDSVVLDIGAATGIHALLACKFGARQVYAIEPNEAIYLARELAEANGFADRIKFIHDLSTHVTLPEPADVIVSDLRGVLPLFCSHIPSIIDARQRHLAAGGTLIPKCDTLWVALVEARHAYQRLAAPWGYPYGLAMEEAKQLVLNSWSDADTDTVRPGSLLMEPQVWAALDYSSIENSDVGRLDMFNKATRDGTAHGLLIWFDTELVKGIGFSNGPAVDRLADVYGRGFFPLLEPVSIAKGDWITLSLRAELIEEDYVWCWHTRIHSQSDHGAVKADFKQSTAVGNASYARPLVEFSSRLRPSLGEAGQLDHFVLGKMDGSATLEQIAGQTRAKFPTRFEDQHEALIYVYELSQHYMR